MNIKQIFTAASTGLLLLTLTAFPAIAAAPWDVTGNYDISFECVPACGGPYVHDATLIQTDLSVDGIGGYPSGGPHSYEWDVTSGSVAGDTITLTMDYTMGAPGTTMTMTGTINLDGSMTGNWTDNFGGVRNGTWSTAPGTAVTKITVPTITTPSNGAIVYQALMTGVDWTDATGTTPSFEYQYQAFSDATYTSLVYSSGWLVNSEIPTPGTPPGDYYLRVRAQDAEGTTSDWSNGVGNEYKVTVIANPAIPAACTGTYGAPIIGTNDSDILIGTSGNDLIFGLDGSDVIDGMGGHDCIVGGNGSDAISGNSGNDVILGGADSDYLQGNNGEDKLYGENGSDKLQGGNHNDQLWGGDGSDALHGGNGNDNLYGNDGSDSLKGDGGTDTADGGASDDACTAETETTCEA